jgi:hypothetical protein
MVLLAVICNKGRFNELGSLIFEGLRWRTETGLDGFWLSKSRLRIKVLQRGTSIGKQLLPYLKNYKIGCNSRKVV